MDYLRVRVWVYDYDGSKSNRDEVRYFKNKKEINTAQHNNEFWKWELA